MNSSNIKIQINSRTRKGKRNKPFGVMIIRVASHVSQQKMQEIAKGASVAMQKALDGDSSTVLIGTEESVKTVQWIRLR